MSKPLQNFTGARMAVRLKQFKILNSHVILALDLFISTLVTLASYWTVCLALHIDIHGLLTVQLAVLSMLCSFLAFYVFKTYRKIIRHTTLKDLLFVGLSCFVKDVLGLLLFLLLMDSWTASSYSGPLNIPVIVAALDFMLSFIALTGLRIVMVVFYDTLLTNLSARNEKVLVYGVGKYASQLLQMLERSKRYEVGGFLRYDSRERGQELGGYKVWAFDSVENLEKIFDKTKIRYVLFHSPADLNKEKDRLVPFCQEHGVRMLIAPEIDKVGADARRSIREIKIEDLLGRDEIEIDLEKIAQRFRGKTVLVTGAAGSIGSELCRQLASLGVGKLILFDNAESPLHDLRLEMERKWGSRLDEGSPEVETHPVIGDVRSMPRLKMVFERYQPEIVFHAAAYKHVPLMEENPCEAVMVNIVGTRNVADCCVKYGVEEMIMISTDKAVNPTNVMGATKRAAEMYVQSLGGKILRAEMPGRTRFTTTRFGNVLGSNGSVIPLFRHQLENGGPLTVTSEKINRFFMSIPEACRLVLVAATLGQGNDIFVFDMGEPVKIIDLARRMITLAGYVPDEDIKIEITGLRPGEKLYEEVLSDAENTVETENRKIRRAKVREVDYDAVRAADETLRELALKVDIIGCVKALKTLVPEFKSKNSGFEILDYKENNVI